MSLVIHSTNAALIMSPSKSNSKSRTLPSTKVKTTNNCDEWEVARVLALLEPLGNEKMRAFNLKHGAKDQPQFGLKMGDIRSVAKKIKANHRLALELWKTKNLDAQFLATLLMNPRELTAKELERLVRSVRFMHLADWLHAYVVKEHSDAESLRRQWMSSANRMELRAGWRLTSGRVAKSPSGLDLAALLDRLEAEMGTAAPEVQWTMNMCLAEIGINFPKLRQRAIVIGERLGVYRDYPVSKGCTSPFAPIWIAEIVRRKK
jgi:3-methyladenine DNA glycosylase AlkD